MKPSKVVCTNCGKPIARGKWCSDKCRMAFKRTGNPNKPEQNKANIQPEHEQVGQIVESEQANSDNPNISTVDKEEDVDENSFRASLTKTDKTFYDRAMRDFNEPYYNFTDKVKEEVCIYCGDKFKTGLAMLRYCSYQHYSDALSARKK